MFKTRATIKLPPLDASDIVSRHLIISFNDRNSVSVNNVQVSPGNVTLPAEPESFTLTAALGTCITMHLVDKDNDGNYSPPSPTLEVTFRRSFAPPTPGPLIIAAEEVLNDGDAPPQPSLTLLGMEQL